MAERRVAADSALRRYLLVLIILLLLLGGLLFAYYALNRPPQLVSGGDQAVSEDQDFRFAFAIYGFEGDLLNRPSGVTIGPDNRIYVADTMKNRVVVFDSRGQFVGIIKPESQGRYAMKWPIAVAVSDDGRIYVLSKQDRKIVVFNQDYQPINIIEFENVIPTCLFIKGDRLYVGTDKAIMIGTLDGRAIKQIGRFGKEEGEFDLIGGITVGDDGTIYVADSLNYRVQAIDEETGEAKWVYGSPIPPEQAIQYQGEDRKFGLPASIALDERGRLYVVDGLNSEIVVLDAETGEKIKTLSDIGHKEGLFYYPDGISYASGGIIAVADKFNDRVQVFNVPVPGIASAIPRWVPWLALLPVAFLILWLLFAPRVRFIADGTFLERVAQSEFRPDIERSLKTVYVLPQVREEFSNSFEKLVLKELKSDDEVARQIRETFAELDDLSAALLSGARKLRGRKTLFTEIEVVADIAEEEYEIATMNYDKLIESMFGKEGEE